MNTLPATTSERIALPLPLNLPAVGAPTGGGISIADILAILRRWFVTIFLLWILFGAIATGAFFLAYKYYPVWSAEAYVEVRSDQPKGSIGIEDRIYSKDESDALLRTQALFVKLPAVLLDALRTVEVRNTSWFRTRREEERLKELDEDLVATPIRGTQFIKISMGARDAKDPKIIIDKVLDSYLAEVQKRTKDEYRTRLADLTKERSNVGDSIIRLQQQIADFIKDLPGGVISGGTTTVGPQMMLAVEQVSQFELFTTQLRKLVEIYSTTDGAAALSPDDKQLVEDSPTITTLVQQESSLELSVNSLLKHFGEKHALVRETQAGLDTVREKLAAERAARLGDIQRWKLDQARTQYYEYQDALLHAKERLADFEAEQADLDRKIAQYEDLKEKLVLARILEERLNEAIRDVERAVGEQRTVDVQAAQRPIDPNQRSWPRWPLLVGGIIGALLLSCAVAVGLEMLDKSVRTPQDIVRHLTVPLLGTVPDVDDEEVEIERVETAVRDAPHSMIAEAFRTIRANLQFSAPADRQRSVVITSPRPEDGKTTIATNLAAALAQNGRRILLVDANFRRPGLHRTYRNGNGNGNGDVKGLSNILIGEAKLADCERRTDVANLDMLSTGPLPPSPAELINSEQFRRFLQDATSEYDQVIIDAPPVLVASDALVIATLVDGAILVCRARENSRGVAQRAVGLLQRVNAHVFGAVLNAAQSRRGGYFREQLRTYYDYQSDEQPSNGRPPALPGGRSAGR